jgi:hypothetical protein
VVEILGIRKAKLGVTRKVIKNAEAFARLFLSAGA